MAMVAPSCQVCQRYANGWTQAEQRRLTSLAGWDRCSFVVLSCLILSRYSSCTSHMCCPQFLTNLTACLLASLLAPAQQCHLFQILNLLAFPFALSVVEMNV